MAASMLARESPAMPRSCDSHTAYSSAVREASVAARHWATQRPPSCTAKSVLVLPCSMARSIWNNLPTIDLSEKHVAGGDQADRAVVGSQPECAGRVQPFGDAFDGFGGQAGHAAHALANTSSASVGPGGAADMCRAKAVAGRSASPGSVARFTPIPTATHRPPPAGPDSTRMPAVLRPAIIVSLGHLSVISVGDMYAAARSATASAATKDICAASPGALAVVK